MVAWHKEEEEARGKRKRKEEESSVTTERTKEEKGERGKGNQAEKDSERRENCSRGEQEGKNGISSTSCTRLNGGCDGTHYSLMIPPPPMYTSAYNTQSLCPDVWCCVDHSSRFEFCFFLFYPSYILVFSPFFLLYSPPSHFLFTLLSTSEAMGAGDSTVLGA